MPARIAERRRAAIADLDIPRPFDLARLLAQVADRRGRMIFVHPFSSGPGIPCGLWLSTATADHIFYEAGTTPWHRTHIKLHELAHIVLGHDSAAGGGLRLADLLAPDVSPALVKHVLGRSIYTTAEERDAETLASHLLGQAGAPAPAAPALGADAGLVLDRLERAWG